MQYAQLERIEIFGVAAHVIAEALVGIAMKLHQARDRAHAGLADTSEQRCLAVGDGPAAGRSDGRRPRS